MTTQAITDLVNAVNTDLVNAVNTDLVNAKEKAEDELLYIVKYCYYEMIGTSLQTDNKILLQIKSEKYILNNAHVHYYKFRLASIFSCHKITNPDFIELLFMFSCFFEIPYPYPFPESDMSKYHHHILVAALYTDNIKLLDFLVDADINKLLIEARDLFQYFLVNHNTGEVFKTLILNNYELSSFNIDYLCDYLLSKIEITRLLLENHFKFGGYIYNYINTEDRLKLFMEFGYDINFGNCYLFDRAFNRMSYGFCVVLLNYGADPKLIKRNTYSKSFLELKEKLSWMNIDISELVSEFKYF